MHRLLHHLPTASPDLSPGIASLDNGMSDSERAVGWWVGGQAESDVTGKGIQRETEGGGGGRRGRDARVRATCVCECM